MVLNTGNSECNFIGGKLCHARYYTLKYTDFENKTAKVDVEAFVQKIFDSNITRYMVFASSFFLSECTGW